MSRWLPLFLLVGCAAVEPDRAAISAVVAEEEARVMWVGAHPDDESLVSPVLAKACIKEQRPCYFLVMTTGAGGECLLREGCRPDLGTLRAHEMSLVAEAYGATLEQHNYFNAPLPMSSFPARHEIGQRWVEQRDPVELITEAILRFKPTVLITFDPHVGFTGHPEHQLTARFAMAAVRKAEAQHRVGAVYTFLNKYWPMRITGGDDTEPDETFDTHLPCMGSARSCLDVGLAITRAHRTQVGDMGTLRSFRPQLGRVYLRKIDPHDGRSAPDPLQPAPQ